MSGRVPLAAALALCLLAPSAAAEGLTVTEMVLGQTRSMIVLPASAAPVFENARERIVADMRNRRLFLKMPAGEDGRETVRLYRVGVGRPEAHLPLGRTRVTGKRVDPSWWPTPRARQRDPFLPAVMGSGGDNPLGSRALNLSWKYYLIHGTNDAGKIGRGATWGCVSLHESEVQDVFDEIEAGTRARFEPVIDIGVGHGFPPGTADGARGDTGGSS